MPRPRTGTILVVDDLDSVRVLVRRQLAALGHTVLEASSAAEALQLIRGRQGKVHLVLSDIVMPEMNGTELASILANENPGLPIVLMSAYTPAGLTRVGFRGAIVPVVQKPFEPGQLAELIQVALDLRAEASSRSGVAGAI